MKRHLSIHQNILGLIGETPMKICEPRGKNGFGWDSVFVPEGYT